MLYTWKILEEFKLQEFRHLPKLPNWGNMAPSVVSEEKERIISKQ